MLLAAVAPMAFLPRLEGHPRWKVGRRRGLYIAEFRYAIKPYDDKALQDFIFLKREHPAPGFEPNPEWITATNCPNLPSYREADYAGKWSFKVEYKVNDDGTITFGSVLP